MQDLKILKEFENPLFKRKEVELIASKDTTPSEKEVLEILSKKFSAPSGAIKISKIYGKFGTKEVKIFADIYDSVQDKNKVEKKTKEELEEEKKITEEKSASEEAKKQEEIKKETKHKQEDRNGKKEKISEEG